MTHKYPTLAQQLPDLTSVNQLCTKALHFARLGLHLNHQLPEPLQSRCRFACVSGTTLVFLADSPTWAAKLRLHLPRLLAHAQRRLDLNVEQCAVRIARASVDSPQPELAIPKRRS